MLGDLVHALSPELLEATIPGGFGGLAIFLLGLRRGHYRNNKFITKALIEITGGMIVASFVIAGPRPLTSFLIGMSWSSILQILRSRITAGVEATLGERLWKE